MNLINSFKDKKVFLTGHTGFKGTWMLLILKHLGAEVKGFSLKPLENSLYEQIKGDELCDSVIGDLRDGTHLNSEIENFEPDFIFHFAAQPLVLESYRNPKYTFDVNIGGSVNVLEAFKQLKKACKLLVITTDKVYKNKESDTPYTENDELGGHDPYSASKAALELVLHSYIYSFNLNNKEDKFTIIARAGNVIGGGDWSENRIVPDIVKSILSNKTITLRNPKSIRPWQHVLDALYGYLLAISNTNEDELIYNFGPDTKEKITVEELTKLSLNTAKKGDYTIKKEQESPKETNLLLLDSSLACSKLGWKPAWNGKEAIKTTINWYLAYSNEASARRLCQEDIKKYFNNQSTNNV